MPQNSRSEHFAQVARYSNCCATVGPFSKASFEADSLGSLERMVCERDVRPGGGEGTRVCVAQ